MRSPDAVSPEQQLSSSSKRKRASDRSGSGHSQHAQHAEGSIGAHLPAEESDRAVKRSKRGLRALNEQRPEMSDKDILGPLARELRAMTSVRGSRHTRRPRSQGGCAKRGEAIEANSTGAEQQATIVMETTIQQLQFELMVGNICYSSLIACLLFVVGALLCSCMQHTPHLLFHSPVGTSAALDMLLQCCCSVYGFIVTLFVSLTHRCL